MPPPELSLCHVRMEAVDEPDHADRLHPDLRWDYGCETAGGVLWPAPLSRRLNRIEGRPRESGPATKPPPPPLINP